MKRTPLSGESELLAQLRKGDALAFTQIYRHYWKPILLVAWNHTQDKDLAEDMVHEVFMNLWESRKALEIRSAAGFLATAVKFRVMRHYQKERNRQELAGQHLEVLTEYDGIAELDARFLQEFLDGIIEQLPERCKLVFKLSREKGLKNSEIAKELGISEKGVEANLTRALKLLRRSIDINTLFFLLCRLTDVG